MTFPKKLNNQQLLTKHPKTKHSNNSKSHVWKPQMKKKFRKKYLVLKNIKNYIFKNFKNSNMTPKHPKTKNKNKKTHVRRPLMKKEKKYS